jgi:hypothetical protein
MEDVPLEQRILFYYDNKDEYNYTEVLHLFSFKTPIFTSYEMKSLINNSS